MGIKKKTTVCRTVLNYPITAKITPLDNGVHILLTGGCRTHIGAVSICDREGLHTIELPGHRESVVSTGWAKSLHRLWSLPVTVACGIHYENASKYEIQAVLAAVESLREELEHGELEIRQIGNNVSSS